MLERALRRSELPVSFTGGFHPLPRLQLALPLPLGVEGHGEWLDLEFVEAIEPAEARRRLQAQLPAELQLLSVAAVPTGGPSLSQELAAARWRLQPALSLPASTWRAAIDQLLAAEALIWEDTDKKGRPRQRDCRPFLLELSCGDDGWLTYEAVIDPQGRSLRPEQLQHWLTPLLPQPLAFQRQQRWALMLHPC
jgi:radical SAM-linked protein